METGEAVLWIILGVLAAFALAILLYSCVAKGTARAQPSSSESAAVIAGATVAGNTDGDEETPSAAFFGGGAKWSSSSGVGPAGLCKSTVWLPEAIVSHQRHQPPVRASRR